MELHLTPEQEADLSRIALHFGKQPESLLVETVLRLIDDNDRYRELIHERIQQADAGVFLEHEEMDKRIQAILQG